MDTLAKLALINPDHPDLNKRIGFMLQSLTTEDIDGILMMTYPGIFEVVPRELLREKVMQTFESDDMTIAMDLFEIDSVGSVIDHATGRYAAVHYTLLMAMRMRKKEEEPEKETEYRAFMLRMFQAAYGRENTWFEETTESYCLYKKNIMIAIVDEQSPQWTFLTYQKGSDMQRFIPAEILILLGLDETEEEDE